MTASLLCFHSLLTSFPAFDSISVDPVVVLILFLLEFFVMLLCQCSQKHIIVPSFNVDHYVGMALIDC